MDRFCGTQGNNRSWVLAESAGDRLCLRCTDASKSRRAIVASSSQAKVDKAVAQLPSGTRGYLLDITREASVQDFFSTIGEFDHLAVTAGESLNLGEFATIGNDLETRRCRGRRFRRPRTLISLGTGWKPMPPCSPVQAKQKKSTEPNGKKPGPKMKANPGDPERRRDRRLHCPSL